MTEFSQAALVALSEWIDAGNSHRDPEALTLHRLIKLTEESGEVVTATIGAFGSNPRKGVTNTFEKVLDELLDVAITALGAYEHIDGHQGRALSELDGKIVRVAERAGVIAVGSESEYAPGKYEAALYPVGPPTNYNPYRFDGTTWFEIWEDGTEHDLTDYYREIEEIGPMRRLT